MERELWKSLSGQITCVDRQWDRGNFTHSTGRIVRVYLWSVLHDRPVDWACRPSRWRGVRPPICLPDQSTMSRRLRPDDTAAFLEELLDRIAEPEQEALVKLLDGKPLWVARHSKDPDAAFGHGAGGLGKGYTLHAIYGVSGRLLTHEVLPLNVSESVAAGDLVADLSGTG